MPKTLHIKGSRTKVLNTFPTSSVGNDGDIIISRIKGRGVYLCTKAGGTWYVANKLQEIRKIEHSSIKELSTNKLTINGIINASKDTDRFVVSDSGQLKYRTSGEVVDDLDIPVVDIYYKNAYCSLGQYTNEEDCMANGGEWYYSDNDSHDSISSTAENELLTIGKSIGSLDAEPTLLYDGSTLEIKYNSDFDDNWQTSAQTDLLKLSYNSSNYCTVAISSIGTTTFNSNSGTYNFQEDGNSRLRINTGTGLLTLHNPDNILDYFSIDIDDDGVTEIKTFDTSATAAHLTIVPDGDLILDPASQKTIINATDGLYFDGGTHTYIAESSDDVLDIYVGTDKMLTLDEANDKITMGATNWVAGTVSGGTVTEFSSANSGFAGMILGCTIVGADVADDAYVLTTSYVCFDDSGGTPIRVSFKTPPSENVEIEVELYFTAGSGASDLELTLSNDATYGSNSLSHPDQFSKSVREPARGHSGTVTQKWYFASGNLSAIGSINHIYIAAKCDSTAGTPAIKWGGDASGEYANLVFKATALPHSVVVGS